MDPLFYTALRFVLFGACISITSANTRKCGTLSKVGPRNIPLQPPDWVFGVVWPCLFVTTGLAWALAGHKADALLSSITLLCCVWLVLYQCMKQKRLAAATLVGTVVLSVIAMLRHSSWWLLPLAIWTTFASYLNLYDAILVRKS